MLCDLEEQRQSYEKFQKTQELAKVLEEIKALKATRAATVPKCVRLRRAEQELAKRTKIITAIDGSLAEALQKVANFEKQKTEANAREQEAEVELERVKKVIVAPRPTVENFSWTKICEGQEEVLQSPVPRAAGAVRAGPAGAANPTRSSVESRQSRESSKSGEDPSGG